MSIYRSSGKNTEIYEEYELYTREYVENVGGSSNFTAKGGTVYGDEPKTAKPLEITNLYVKVRLASDYKGEFGFDWLDVNPETKEIEKIQDVPFSEVEYFYKKDSANPLGGTIVEKSTDEIGAKHAIQDHYKFNPISKHIDIPYVLIKPEQKITLSVEVMLWQGEITDDVIAITGDEFYEFEIVGGEKEGKTAKKKLTGAGKLDLKITCLKAGPEKTYDFNHSNSTTGSHAVGGLTMMENKVLTLKFRVIALLAKDGTESVKAKALFQKFKDGKVKEFLSENSLNQAGYEVEIENQAMFDTLEAADLDDYIYAFDKEEWRSKKYFGNVIRQEYDVIPGTNTCKPTSVDASGNCKKVPVATDVIVDDPNDIGLSGKANAIDDITITEYANKLKAKGKAYDGGIIILSDFQSSDEQTGAYSRTTPLNHYALIVYSKNTGSKDTYAHEIGHMLGLPHLFFDAKEKDSYKIAKENILGNNELEFTVGGAKNDKYQPGISNLIKKVKASKSNYHGYSNLIAIKSHIISKLINHNESRQSFVNKQTAEKKIKEAYYINYKDSDMITFSDGSRMSKKKYLQTFDDNIKEGNEKIKTNRSVISELQNRKDVNNYVLVEEEMWFMRSELITLLDESKKYYDMVIEQVHSNYLMFLQGKTKNIMDYHNSRVVYLANQIKIMRNDMQNYIDIIDQKPKPKKK